MCFAGIAVPRARSGAMLHAQKCVVDGQKVSAHEGRGVKGNRGGIAPLQEHPAFEAME